MILSSDVTFIFVALTLEVWVNIEIIFSHEVEQVRASVLFSWRYNGCGNVD